MLKHVFILLLMVLLCSCTTFGPPVVTAVANVAQVPSKVEPPKKKPAEHTSIEDAINLDPYFADVMGGEAYLNLAQDQLQAALEGFDEIANLVSNSSLTPRARFLGAFLAGRQGNYVRALDELPKLADELPLIADTAREQAACAAIKLHKYDRAIELAGLIRPDSFLASDAVLLRADALAAKENWEQAIAAYNDYLTRWPSRQRGPEARSRIIECLAASVKKEADKAKAEEALRRLDELRAQSPASRWTKKAAKNEEALYKTLGKTIPRERQDKRAAIAAYEKASILKRKMRNAEARQAYDKVIRLARKKGTLRCRARYEQAEVVARLRQYERAAELFDNVAKDCQSPNIRVKALYRGGKAYQSAERFNDAIRLYAEVETDFSTHSYADDARLHAARSRLSQGLPDSFVEMLRSLPDDYPSGDMRAEALWTVAHFELQSDDLVAAESTLKKYYELFPSERGWYSAGRSGYWLGRVEEKLGLIEKASAHYEHVIASAPLSFYMVLAYNRLSAHDSQRARECIERLAPTDVGKKTQYSRSLLEEYPSLAIGLELYRLGLTTRSKRQFDTLLAQSDIPAEVHWIAAAAMRRAGLFEQLREITSKADAGWKKRYPSGHEMERWKLAYPTAYEDEVKAASQTSSISPAIIWAVMREESGFNPKIESWANAIGLMQLILPTARTMGRQLDIKVNRKTLRDPAVNIALGTAYLAFLGKKFNGHPAMMIAGYNAGEGAVGKWLRNNGDLDLDMFVEQIPYSQTRGYTKRVISSLAIYIFLYQEGREILELPMNF